MNLRRAKTLFFWIEVKSWSGVVYLDTHMIIICSQYGDLSVKVQTDVSNSTSNCEEKN